MRRASFPKSVIRRVIFISLCIFPNPKLSQLISQFAGVSVGQNVVIAIAGMAKVFTGELIEEGWLLCFSCTNSYSTKATTDFILFQLWTFKKRSEKPKKMGLAPPVGAEMKWPNRLPVDHLRPGICIWHWTS
jgi:hypothetical protein